MRATSKVIGLFGAVAATVVFCSLSPSTRGQETAVAVANAPPTDDAARLAADVASFDQVWRTIRDRSWGELDLAAWEKQREELRPRVEASESIQETRAILGQLIDSLSKSHYAIIPADLYDKIKSAKEEKAEAQAANDDDQDDDEADLGETGLSLRLVDGQALVTRVAPESAAAAAGIEPGWELIKFKDQDVAELYTELRRELPKTSPYRPETLGALSLEGKLEGDVGSSFALTFRNGNDETVPIDLVFTERKGNVIKFGHLPEMVVKSESHVREDGIGYVWFNLFFDPVTVTKDIQQALKSADRGLVLDLRGNHGGLAGMTMGVGNHFVSVDTAASGSGSAYLGTLRTKDTQLRFALSPRARPYTGPVAVLIDECSISSAEILAGGLQAIGRARLFGVQTAGAALPSTVELLPNRDRFQFAIAGYTDSSGRDIEGQGVVPDEPVQPTRAALLAGHDPVLEAAVTWIEQQTAPE